MIITKIEIIQTLDCEHIQLEFPLQQENSTVFVLQSLKECDVVSTAIQLICSKRFDGPDSLNTLKDKLQKGKITISFLLRDKQDELDTTEEYEDTPCSFQEHKARRTHEGKIWIEQNKAYYHSITATRDFSKDPFVIEYTFNGNATIIKTIEMFHSTFFNAVDFLLPNLLQLAHGQNCNGKWINMIPFDKEEDDLLKEFCFLHDSKQIDLNNLLAKLVTITLTSRSAMQLSRISVTLQVFFDVRHIFEYITCSEYTVWFRLPTVSGHTNALTNIMQEIDFEKMQTILQLKTKSNNSIQMQWFEAELHIQELLLVSIQLAFAHHCQQKIVFLRNLKNLSKHQNFELFNAVLAGPQNIHELENWFTKHYLQRIVDACLKLSIASVIEVNGSSPLSSTKAFIINCKWLNKSWYMNVTTRHHFQSQIVRKFLHVIQNIH